MPSFRELRKELESERVDIKSYVLDGNTVVIAKEGTNYVAYINDVNISDGFEDFRDAELGAKEAVWEIIVKKQEKN